MSAVQSHSGGAGTRIVLVRHGHVEGIAPPRFRGRIDLPLTEHGLRQAAATRDYLASIVRPAAVYTSPLSRCVRTAEILAEPYSLIPHPLPAFTDIDYGDWQGKSFAEVQASSPEAFTEWLRTPHMAAIPNGESLYEAAARVAAVVRFLLSQVLGETVFLVGHDSVNRILLLFALDLPLSRYWSLQQVPCAVSILERGSSGGWICASINEIAHLRSAT